MEFEWDPAKAAVNLRKHRVSFDEAATLFGDFPGATAPDPDHSASEHRFITVGKSERGRLPVVAHTGRRDRVRMISARKLLARERKAYEDARE